MSREDLEPELEELQAALRDFCPAPSGVSHDRVLFLAGQASVRGRPGADRRRRAWLWPCATAASWLATLVLAGTMLLEHRAQGVPGERIAAVAPPPGQAVSPAGNDSSPQSEPDRAESGEAPAVTSVDWPPESSPIPSPKRMSFWVIHDTWHSPDQQPGG